jgi:undecaprenyl-diphosphatase
MRLLDSIHRVDLSAFAWFVKHKHRDAIIRVSRFVSLSADGPLYVIAGVAFILLQNWDIAQLMALGFLLERSCYKVFKGLFKRNRPPEAIPGFKSVVEPSDRFSFPSGHTSAAFLVASIFTYFSPLLGLILLPWAAAVGVARVVLGVHFPSDVIAGALMGFSLFAASAALLF